MELPVEVTNEAATSWEITGESYYTLCGVRVIFAG
jgi:hypothetical protein